MAMSRSPSLQNFASMGESGKKKNEITENTSVIPPQKRKII
jgi:hypothetical protein